MAKNQQKHDHEVEKSELERDHKLIENERLLIESNSRDILTGQKIGGLLSFFAISCSVVLVILGHEVSGTILGGSTLVSLVIAFIKGRSKA